ncbi:MAG: hypothetical protein ACMXYB_01850 [Candidatus Woesearchaeota archaeon]
MNPKIINFSKKGEIYWIVVFIIIIVIFILVSFTQRGVFDSFTSASDERQCLTLINNIDSIIKNGNLELLRARFNQYCKLREVKINNQQQFVEEIKICNSRAQNIIQQRNFIEENPNICVPCSSIKSSEVISIQLSTIFNNQIEKNSIINEILELNQSNAKQVLQFKIISNNKIVFEIVNSTQSQCITFLN